MKRLVTLAGLAFAALIGSFAMSAPAHAASTVTCSTPTTTGNVYPHNYLWICDGTGTVSTSDVDAVVGVLGQLGNVGSSSTSDAKTRMSTDNNYIYVFANLDDFNGTNAYCTTAGNNTANPPIPFCISFLSTDVAKTATGANPSESIIIENLVNAAPNTNMANTAGHEAGHQLDWLYGVALNGSGYISSQGNTPATTNEFAFKLTGMKAVLTGTITNGDTLNLIFNGTVLSCAPVTITHNVMTGDTLTSIASDFVSKINANSSLTAAAIGAHATSSSGTVSVTTNATTGASPIMTYSKSSTGSGHTTITLSSYDWPAFDTLTACSQSAGIFAGQKHDTGIYICSSIMSATITGTITPGNVVAFSLNDTALGMTNNPQHATYTVQTGDTTTKIATELAASINGNSLLSGIGITATSSTNTVTVNSGTNNTTYANTSSMGATESISGLSSVSDGDGNTLSYAYRMGTTNDSVLQVAWPYYFSNNSGNSTLWRELFAEQTAVSAGGHTGTGNETQDHYLNSGKFPCSLNFVNAIEFKGAVPSATNYPYSSGCQ